MTASPIASLLPAPAHDEAPAPAKAAAAPAPAAAPVDPAAAQAVRELFKVMKVNDMFSSSFAQMTQILPNVIRQAAIPAIEGNPRLNGEQKNAEVAKLEKAIPEASAKMKVLLADPTLMTEMLEASIPVYARNFSIDEIRQMTAFYRTGVGSKMLTVMPRLMSEAMQVSQAVVVPRLNKLIAEYTPAAK